jgi:hypothetical protein
MSYYIYLIPLTLSALLSLRTFRAGWAKHFRYFSVFLLLSLLVEILAILWKWGLCKTAYWSYSTSNLWIYNAFLPIRYLVLLVFFHGLIVVPAVKLAIRWIAAPFLLFSILNYFFIQTPHHASTYTIIACNAITVLLSLCFFFQIPKIKPLIHLTRSAGIWICLGLLLYHAGTLPLFIFFDYLITKHLSLALSYFYINDLLNILTNLIYLIAFLCQSRSQQ